MRPELARLTIARVPVAGERFTEAPQLEITRQQGAIDVTLLLGRGKNPACFAYALDLENEIYDLALELGPKRDGFHSL